MSNSLRIVESGPKYVIPGNIGCKNCLSPAFNHLDTKAILEISAALVTRI
jgi:hypothetical protein